MIDSRKAYIYLKGTNQNEIISVLNIYEEYSVKQIEENYLEITIIDEFNVNTLKKARDFIMVELFQDFTAFANPINFTFPIQEILDVLPNLNKGIYLIEDLIYELVKLNKIELIKRLRNYYYNHFSPETIETILGFIDQDLNATKTSKALYMHRNTLNYRLDNFIKKTEIDVRKFSGALAIYLLFRY
ncbi:MAG: helix-turn-helix domain-containing protein [Tenericutes bacterium]|nr:helix-turn-helix domain-containing protein [Mycoplasmatota bacterium]